MRNLLIFAVLILVVLIGFALLKGKTSRIYEPKVVTQGEVTIEVKPEKFGVGEKENVFEVKFDTHSIDLDFDFAKIIVLVDDSGNIYQAQRWEGERGGHHLEGKIVFPRLKTGVRKVSLVISKIADQGKTLSWEI